MQRRYIGDKMKKIIFEIFILSIVLSNCILTENENDINIKFIIKEWKHSYEEEKDSVLIFRPSNYQEFPPSRFRGVYEFRFDYTLKYLFLAPNDGHYFKEGYWNYNSENKVLQILNSENEIIQEYQIIILEENILKLIRT